MWPADGDKNERGVHTDIGAGVEVLGGAAVVFWQMSSLLVGNAHLRALYEASVSHLFVDAVGRRATQRQRQAPEQDGRSELRNDRANKSACSPMLCLAWRTRAA